MTCEEARSSVRSDWWEARSNIGSAYAALIGVVSYKLNAVQARKDPDLTK